MTGPGTTRRRFLLGLGRALGRGRAGRLLEHRAARHPRPGGHAAAAEPPRPPRRRPVYEGDAALMAVAAALSGLAGDLLGQAGAGAGQGRYGSVPGVVTAFLSGAAAQHVAHAEAWNRLLTNAGRPPVDGYPLTVEPALRGRLVAAVAPVDLLGLAADVTATVTATVTAIAGRATETSTVALAAGVAPVSAMHGATADFLLGRPPTAPTDPTAGALGPDALTV